MRDCGGGHQPPRERALLIGQRIGNEDGIKEAMKLIERHTSEFKTNVDSVF